MIHSPFGTLSPALTASANTDNEAIRRRRFIEFEGKQYLCRKRKSATRGGSASLRLMLNNAASPPNLASSKGLLDPPTLHPSLNPPRSGVSGSTPPYRRGQGLRP